MRARLAFVAAVTCVLLSACAARNSDDAFVDSTKRIRPSVVLLTMKIPPEHKSDGYDDGYATGFVIASGAWGSDILTVQHAIQDAWDLSITIDNKIKAPVRVIAQNADLDIALLRTTKPNLPVITLGSSAHLHDDVGRQVGLIGYPVPDEFEDEELGLATSLNSGHLSSIRKDALEVTLSIIPGESGAPVFIADSAEVVGIAESRLDDEHAIGFALPIDEAKKFLHKYDAVHGF